MRSVFVPLNGPGALPLRSPALTTRFRARASRSARTRSAVTSPRRPRPRHRLVLSDPARLALVEEGAHAFAAVGAGCGSRRFGCAVSATSATRRSAGRRRRAPAAWPRPPRCALVCISVPRGSSRPGASSASGAAMSCTRPMRQRLGGVEALGRQEVAARRLLAHRPHHVRPDGRRDQAEPASRSGRTGARGARRDVAGGHQAHAAGDRRRRARGRSSASGTRRSCAASSASCIASARFSSCE